MQPGDFLGLTPGELTGLYDCWIERQEAEWLRTAALGEWIRGQVWGKEGRDRYQLSGLPKPISRELSIEDQRRRWTAKWMRIADSVKRSQAG